MANYAGSERTLGAAFGFGVSAEASSSSAQEMFAALFEQYREALFRYLVLLSNNPGVSEELVQETFLKLHRLLADGQRVDNVRAWLFRVGHNLAIDSARTARQSYSLSEPEVTRDVERRFPQSDRDPESELLLKEQMSRLNRAIESLPDVQRHCLFLRREGFRYREIALILGIGETTVNDNIGRAVARLHREFHVPA